MPRIVFKSTLGFCAHHLFRLSEIRHVTWLDVEPNQLTHSPDLYRFYPAPLHDLVKSCLQVDSEARPSAYQLMDEAQAIRTVLNNRALHRS